jgi:exodeoxyribonuclease V alpha subunit
MEVCVTKIISKKTFGCIFKASIVNEAESSSIVVKAHSKNMLGTPSVGEIWDVNGHETGSRFGRQLEAHSCVRKLPTGLLIKNFLTYRCPGIGPARAGRLWQHYGMDLPSALTTDNMRELAQVIDPSRPILALRLASYVVFAWKEAKAESELVTWFQGFGIDDFSLVKLCKQLFADKAIDVISKNPYILSSMLLWDKCDCFGLKILNEVHELSSPHVATERMLGAVNSSLRDVLADGHTCIASNDLQNRLAKKLVKQNNYQYDIVNKAIRLAIENNAVVCKSNNTFLPPGSNYLENQVKDNLISLLGLVNLEFEKTRLQLIIDDLSRNNNPPDDQQRAAIMKSVKQGLTCLVGGAGTGKTTTLRYIVHTWKRLGGNVLMCALAGKAALRLSQATGLIAKTLAMTLRDLANEDSGVEINDKTLVVIDEASMLDLPTLYQVLKKFTLGAKLLLCGDPYQLPPIGFGLIFHKLVNDESITTTLTNVYRQSESTGIPAVASKIKNKQMPDFSEYIGLKHGVSFIDCSLDNIHNIIQSVVADLGGFNSDELLIVTATNKGNSGIEALNKKFHKIHIDVNDLPEIKGFLGQYFSPVEPVIHLRNDYKRALFNGSFGEILEVNVEDNSLVTRFDGEQILFEREQLIDLALAYAITCHKCQGSQVQRVIVPIYPTRILDPSWLYTAITRASEQVVLVGDRNALIGALQRPFASERRKVGFEWYEERNEEKYER